MKRTTQEGLLNVYIFVLKKQETKQTPRERERKGKSNQTKWQKVRRVEQKYRKQKSSEKLSKVK